VKNKLTDHNGITREELKGAFIAIFNEIDKDTLLEAFSSSVKRTKWVCTRQTSIDIS
jgi:hypothetical protein